MFETGPGKKIFRTMLLVFVLVLAAAGRGFCDEASEYSKKEARRHFDRGMAAVEMAKSAEDYEDAVSEFQMAVSYDPEWLDARYNLALVQDKAGMYIAALENLKIILEKSSGQDTAKIESLITKVEYKQEKAQERWLEELDRKAEEEQRRMDESDIPYLGANVTSLKFYEAGTDGLEYDAREYSNYFPRSTARRIWCQLDLEHPDPGHKKDFDLDVVYIKPNGDVMGRYTTSTWIEPGWTWSYHNFNWGWDGRGNWPTGRYQVEVYYQGKLIATEEFSIY